MKILLSLCVTLLALNSAPAALATESGRDDPAQSAPRVNNKDMTAPRHPWTLDDARRNAHELADKLDKMTPQEWTEIQKKREESLRKWARMSPEERKTHMGGRRSGEEPAAK